MPLIKAKESLEKNKQLKRVFKQLKKGMSKYKK
jgi:hypothetical protein